MKADPQELVSRLTERNATVATAESLTDGQLSVVFTAVPGSSECFVGGVVTYATEAKVAVLHVKESIIDEHGAVSAECASEMASGARSLLGATYALSTTGVAGPESQEGHPPGHVWVACAGPEGVETRLLSLDGDRAKIQDDSCRGALSLLDDVLRQEDSGLG